MHLAGLCLVAARQWEEAIELLGDGRSAPAQPASRCAALRCVVARCSAAARQRDCEGVAIVTNIEDEGVRALVAPFGFELSGDVLRLQLQRR